MATLSRLPRHIAIIMDGNGRWARQRFLPRYAGHKAGVESVRQVVETCGEQGIEILTLFAFSSENWQRPEREVSFLMDLFINALQQEILKLHRNRVCLSIIGEREKLSERLQQQINKAEELTRNNTGLRLVIAANYGGKWDILQATRRLMAQAQSGEINPAELTAARFESELSLGKLPPPDFFIRTGGERRLSNFLLWHLAYAELYFTDILWPDFNRQAFLDALADFSSRQRRFGRTGEQVEQNA